MGTLPVELQLALTLSLSAFVLVAAYRFARGWSGGPGASAASDALLIFYLTQYLAVGVTGLLGVLNPATIAMVSAAVAAGLAWLSPRRPQPAAPADPSGQRPNHLAHWLFSICFIVILSYVLVLVWLQRTMPPVANDPLTYHLPAAVQWLQQHRISLYDTWLYNPANTYSPLAGSMFLAWLMAPMDNDVLARFAQAPALLLLFFAMVEFGRGLGGRAIVIVLLAMAAVLSRPFISQVILAKDDLFLAAFFAAAVAGLSRDKLGDPLGPWRVGAAIGLMLATKYTALLSVPGLLLAVDAPFRGGWRLRWWIIAIAVILAIAGPWYLRNLLLTGNPLYPTEVSLFGVQLLPGMFTPARSERLQTLKGIWDVLADNYYSLPTVLWEMLGILWCVSAARLRSGLLAEPLARVAVLGPVVGIGLFLLVSPYGESRFINPSLTLLFGSAMLACSALPRPAGLAAAAGVVATSLATNFIMESQHRLLPIVAGCALTTGLIVAGWALIRHQRVARLSVVALGATAAAAWVFVNWQAFLIGYRALSTETYKGGDPGYGPLAEAWQYVRDELPDEPPLAYANTYFVYPLYGFDLNRRVVYAPLRAGVRHVHDLPRIDGPLSGERIGPAIAHSTCANPDRQAWLENLCRLGAGYLFVAKQGLADSSAAAAPAELSFAEQDPARFHKLFENSAAAVYSVHP